VIRLRCRRFALTHRPRLFMLVAFLAGCVAEQDTVAVVLNGTPTIPTFVRPDASSSVEPSDETADAASSMSDAYDREDSVAAEDAGLVPLDAPLDQGSSSEVDVVDASPAIDAGDPDSGARAYYFPIIPWLLHRSRDE
jgi:hypothetical protein